LKHFEKCTIPKKQKTKNILKTTKFQTNFENILKTSKFQTQIETNSKKTTFQKTIDNILKKQLHFKTNVTNFEKIQNVQKHFEPF
jgi:hypothetical protein